MVLIHCKTHVDSESKENYEQRMQRLNSTATSNVQMEHRLERYMAEHCYDLYSLREFIGEVDQNLLHGGGVD